MRKASELIRRALASLRSSPMSRKRTMASSEAFKASSVRPLSKCTWARVQRPQPKRASAPWLRISRDVLMQASAIFLPLSTASLAARDMRPASPTVAPSTTAWSTQFMAMVWSTEASSAFLSPSSRKRARARSPLLMAVLWSLFFHWHSACKARVEASPKTSLSSLRSTCALCAALAAASHCSIKKLLLQLQMRAWASPFLSSSEEK
mmetsp:Transcript_64935/g.139064  ORF Transcript_64935/g.139064 Transcript_64935/m.139064 type:complete len:207 (+) Transcript_64935:721-1341(+)